MKDFLEATWMKKRYYKKRWIKYKPGCQCRGKIWIEINGKTFLGIGRVVLLERIHEHGSISKAARSMNMSYKHAWDLIDSMNRQAKKPLVVTSKGGKGGGGAKLTESGVNAVRLFWKIYKRFNEFLNEETEKIEI